MRFAVCLFFAAFWLLFAVAFAVHMLAVARTRYSFSTRARTHGNRSKWLVMLVTNQQMKRLNHRMENSNSPKLESKNYRVETTQKPSHTPQARLISHADKWHKNKKKTDGDFIKIFSHFFSSLFFIVKSNIVIEKERRNSWKKKLIVEKKKRQRKIVSPVVVDK